MDRKTSTQKLRVVAEIFWYKLAIKTQRISYKVCIIIGLFRHWIYLNWEEGCIQNWEPTNCVFLHSSCHFVRAG